MYISLIFCAGDDQDKGIANALLLMIKATLNAVQIFKSLTKLQSVLSGTQFMPAHTHYIIILGHIKAKLCL